MLFVYRKCASMVYNLMLLAKCTLHMSQFNMNVTLPKVTQTLPFSVSHHQ